MLRSDVSSFIWYSSRLMGTGSNRACSILSCAITVLHKNKSQWEGRIQQENPYQAGFVSTFSVRMSFQRVVRSNSEIRSGAELDVIYRQNRGAYAI